MLGHGLIYPVPEAVALRHWEPRDQGTAPLRLYYCLMNADTRSVTELVDLCSTSNDSSSTSVTATPYVGHRRRNLRRAGNAAQPPVERVRRETPPAAEWKAPVIVDFDSSEAEDVSVQNKKPQRVVEQIIEPNEVFRPEDDFDEVETEESPSTISRKDKSDIPVDSSSEPVGNQNAKEEPNGPVRPFLPTKRVEPLDLDNDIANFFCKASAPSVMKLLEEAEQVQEKTEEDGRAMKKRKFTRNKQALTTKVVESVEDKKADEGPTPITIDEEVVEERPSWAALLEGPIRPSEPRRILPKTPKTTAAPTPAPTAATLNLDVEIDPALKEALQQRSKAAIDETPAVAMSFKIRISSMLTRTDIAPDAAPREPLAFQINTKTSFGQVKQAYCSAKKLSPHNMILTYNDTILYDTVLASGSKLFPEPGSDTLHLRLYDRSIYDLAKAEQQKARADAHTILRQQPAAAGPIDVSAYMMDSVASQSEMASASADGKISIKIQVDRNQSDTFRVSPSDKLEDLLRQYLAKFPETEKTKARFIFDGDSLPMPGTIDDAGLEDGDMIELKLT